MNGLLKKLGIPMPNANPEITKVHFIVLSCRSCKERSIVVRSKERFHCALVVSSCFCANKSTMLAALIAD